MKKLFFVISIFLSTNFYAQGYWQQHANYMMQIDFDVKKGQFSGVQQIQYTNNSPDTLSHIYYHLYYNAFQPGSQMDMRNLTIADPDSRIGSKIHYLQAENQGYHKVSSLKQDNANLNYKIEGTILEVELATPILPGATSLLEMEFESQVPLVIRRSGKFNKEGIAYSMAQWYPKLAEYDKDGWHANEYISREFYGVWSNYDVEITLDSAYTVAATGYLQNADKIGHGYTSKKVSAQGKRSTWKFSAPKVHDFVWAADTDFKHDVMQLRDSLQVHFFYQADTCTENWDTLKYHIASVFTIMDTTFGKYPYKQYSFIQGGDGGMEYPMATLVAAHRPVKRFLATAVHELIHNWYYGVLANNESVNAWMDEGFTSYAEDYVMDLISPDFEHGPRLGKLGRYPDLIECDHQEALTTPADFYNRNRTYYTSVYQKGELFLNQLRYIMGDALFYQGMTSYFNAWKFKHPTPKDFLRVMELTADMELDWFFHYWIETTEFVDYAVKGIIPLPSTGTSEIIIQRVGKIPMPVELTITTNTGNVLNYYLPLRLMRGSKVFSNNSFTALNDWPWTYPEYALNIPVSSNNILSIEIDKNQMTADIKRENNFSNDIDKLSKKYRKERRKNKKKINVVYR